MKDLITIALCIFGSSLTVFAQQAGIGMHYQAIARDLDGMAIAHTDIDAQVEMFTVDNGERVLYTEFHSIRSNQFGLLNFTIGTGEALEGDFESIPWSSQNIWIKVSIKRSADEEFQVITTNKLQSVPYAFYAQQAGELSTNGMQTAAFPGGGQPGTGPSSGSDWSIRGNEEAQKHNDPPLLGTVDNNPIVFITNGKERITITEEGTVELTGDLLSEQNVNVAMGLNVAGDVAVNTAGGTTVINGPTTIGGSDMNQATFTGNVQVDKQLNVDGNSSLNGETTIGGSNMNDATFTGAVRVDKNMSVAGELILDSSLVIGGKTTIGGALTVMDTARLNGPSYLGGTDMNPTMITGNAQFDKNVAINGKVNIEDSMTVRGATTFDIEVTGDQTEQTSYPVLIKGSDQGLAIDLTPAVSGIDELLRSHRGNNYISFWRDGEQKGRIEGMGRADLDPTGLVSLVVGMIDEPPPILSGGGPGVTYDPFSVGNPNTISGLLSFGTGTLPSLQNLLSFSPGSLPSVSFSPPSFDAGSLPSFTNSLPFSPGTLPNLGFGSISDLIGFSDPFASNDYSPFTPIIEQFNGEDVVSPANLVWTTIKSTLMASGIYPDDPTNFESQIFSNYTLDVIQQGIGTLSSAITFLTSLASVLDPEDIFAEGVDVVANVISLIIYGSYADINLGVAYESGAGDYAEWLLRADPNELIMPGDVVGVIGGRISKNFIHADKFMVISTSPLLLGNMPENKIQEQLHEKVAFMGQVPVKVVGDVSVGDYILPSGKGDGFAIAIAPDEMLTRDYQRIIGVAWESNTSDEFVNLINTAVGINHNDMSRVIEEMQYTLNEVQLALQKMDSSFEPRLYNVDAFVMEQNELDYSVSSTHMTQARSYFQGKTYTSRMEMCADIKHAMKEQAGINLESVPMIEYFLDNPQYAARVAKEYQQVLDEMIQVRDHMIASRH